MIIQREWVTPITAGAFLLSAATGILMFFHADTGLNKAAHEWLSWVLLGGVALHAMANFAGFKRHLGTRRGQVLVGVFALALLFSFAPLGKKGEPPFAAPIRALSQAPLATLAQVAQVSPEQLRERLMMAGLQPKSDQQSLSDLVGPDTRKQILVLGTLLATD
jgi:peptidoglycan/LPS O-acetylase OafA/YrhL